MRRIIFVTATDTGVGKTIVTALLLHHLRQTGVHALAMKPFCSGGRGDITLLQSLQNSELTDEEINPYYFDQAVAPRAALSRLRRTIRLAAVVRRIRSVAEKCECLLVEGIGGLLVPLGQNFMVIDLIRALSPDVILVAANKLGTINHMLLSARALEAIGVRKFKGVLGDLSKRDLSRRANLPIVRASLKPNRVFSLPYLGPNLDEPKAIKESYRKVKKLLACLHT